MKIEAWEEDECLLCVTAHHENCEMDTTIGIVDRASVPLGEDASDHVFEIPVCHLHLSVIKQYQAGKTVAEVTQP